MSDPQPPDDRGADDTSADTQMFRAFVEREDSAPVQPRGPAFQLITLGVGLVVLVGIIFLLLKM